MNVSRRPVTVIVPVYGGLAYTAALPRERRAARRAARVPIELLVIDDASPELPLREYVDEFAARPAPFPVTVLHNPENLGFVAHREPRAARRGAATS